MSAFLWRFKANYLEKMHGYPNFSSWIPIDLLFPCGPNLAQKPLYLVGTILKEKEKYVKFSSNLFHILISDIDLFFS